MNSRKDVTIERFLLETQPDAPNGDLTALLNDLALAAKIITAQTRRAGLLDILGAIEGLEGNVLKMRLNLCASM